MNALIASLAIASLTYAGIAVIDAIRARSAKRIRANAYIARVTQA